ncbi:F0F1 ATP synthase subunit delta [Pseudomonas leptonychotis]|uniref:F0F1 ATP synthase subunit delta n=1 Tax=Pseudomonas leptonychotis TaxID=2448482 RepID=UPI0038640816
MLIDWFTVGAQLLNFIILVYLMKRFLYQPVLDAIAAREHKIATELADAAATKAKAHEQQAEFKQKNQAFDEQRAALLNEATEAANAERERLLGEAREAAETASAAREKALLADTQALHGEIVRQTQQQVFEIARRVLADLADASLEQRACAVFIQRLHAVDGETLAALSTALKATSAKAPALLRSAFDLPAEQLAAIQTALDETFGQTIALKVETAPEVVSGIELSAQGQKLAWSIADYLTTLSAALNDHPAEMGTA